MYINFAVPAAVAVIFAEVEPEVFMVIAPPPLTVWVLQVPLVLLPVIKYVLLAPIHKLTVVGVIEPATTFGFTVMVMPVLVKGLPVAQGEALEFSTQVTTSPLFNVELLKVGLFVPTLPPFTFH